MVAFSPHGSLNIVIENNIIIIEAQGPWNIEYLELLHMQLFAAVQKVDQSNYVILLTLKGEAISVGSGLEYHLKFIQKGNAKAVALNLAHCTTPLLTENLFTRLYQTAKINYAFFDNSHDAHQWLESQLTVADLSQHNK